MHIKTHQIASDLLISLGYDPKCPPLLINESEAAFALGLQKATLSQWRISGRYELPYIKAGRMVRYRVFDLADFIVRRESSHT